MVRLESLNEEEREMLLGFPCPSFATSPWVTGPPLSQRRVALITTAGLHRRDDRPFSFAPNDFYRIIPGDVNAGDLVMSHISAGFDRTGFQRDWNVVFPLDRLRELATEGVIGSLADFHYSVNSARKSEFFEAPAREIAGLLKQDGVDAVLLFPV
jgi:D-proline reductase (dithiol) PrdB